MKKVLIIGNCDEGLYKFRRELVQKLLNEYYEVTFSTPMGEYVTALKNMGCRYLQIEYNRAGKNLFADLNLLKKYKQILSVEKWDVVLLYTIKPTLYAGMVCRWKKIPYLVNITGLSPAITNSRMLKELCFIIYRHVLKYANMVFFQNQQNLTMFQKERTLRENYKLIPGSGVNLDEHTFEEYVENSDIHILYIGRITKVKGIDELLEAIEKLAERIKCVKFEFIGKCDEQYQNRIEQLNEQGKIVYYGSCMTPHEYIKKIQAVIMPSYGEGMSNVLLEAAAVGRPVLASDVVGCRETMIDGVTGISFLPHNVEAIVDAVEKFANMTMEQRRNMGLAGREHVAQNFSREIVIREYMEQINSICKEKENESL